MLEQLHFHGNINESRWIFFITPQCRWIYHIQEAYFDEEREREKKNWWSISMSWLLLCLKSFRSISSLFKYFTAKLLTWFLIVTLFTSNSQGTMCTQWISYFVASCSLLVFFFLFTQHSISLDSLVERESLHHDRLLTTLLLCCCVSSVQEKRDEKWLSSLTKKQ